MRALLCVILVSTAANADWPQFRGPSQGTSADKGIPTTWSATQNVIYKIDLPGAGTSSPVILGENIFLTAYTGKNEDLTLHVLCLNRANGDIKWNKTIPPKLPEQMKIREDHGYASGTPLVDNDGVYVSFGKTGVFAFDHQGNQLWQADIGDTLHGWGSSISPVLYNELVIVNASVESDSLIALNKKTGTEVWRARGIKESWNTPILVDAPGDKKELVVAIMGSVLGFDPDKGEKLWSAKTDIGWYMVPTLVAHEGVVYCIGGRGGGGALAVKTGGRGEVTGSHRAWTAKKGSNVSSLIYHDGHLYWMNDSDGTAYCANARTGEIVYNERIPRPDQIYASPVLVDGKIIYLGRGGRAFVVAAKPQWELIATNTLDRGMYNASPAVAGGRLYIRSDKSLYCIGTK